MRALLTCVGLLAACGSDSSPVTWAPPPERGPLRVMSYNVNFGVTGDGGAIAAIAAISDARADLVFLQETNPAWEAALLGGLRRHYPHRRFTHSRAWPAGGMGLLSRFEIIALDELPPAGGPFFAWRVVVDTNIGRLQVLHVHLRPPRSDGGSWVVGYFSTRADRLREIQSHLDALAPSLPTLIVGDFNEELDGLAIQHLLERHYADAIATFHGSKPTWQWPVGSLTLRFQLDHLLHDARLVPVDAQIVDAGHSDHRPIWADFQRGD